MKYEKLILILEIILFLATSLLVLKSLESIDSGQIPLKIEQHA